MPGKCEYIMNSCRPAPYREPRKPPSTLHPAWRFATMHLKPYPKFQKKELQLESGQDTARILHTCQQGSLRTDRPVRQSCPPGAVPSNGTASHQPLSVITSNNLCKSSSAPPKADGEIPRTCRKGNVVTSSLLLLSSVPEQDSSLTLYQGDSGDGQLDIWAVIKPGNTKEKIAIFAAQQCGLGSSATGGNGEHDIPASLRTVSMKIKGCWEVEGTMAKRRKRSSEPDQSGSLERQPQGGEGAEREARGEEPRCRAAPQRQEQQQKEEEDGDGEDEGGGEEEGGKTLSVVEMVAYLEQRANEQQVDCSKPLPLRSSGTKAGSGHTVEQPGGPEALENREEGESVRVLDMVAKLESECLKRQNEREGGGSLSRNNSLRRSVGRVLLAGVSPDGRSEACSPSTLSLPEPEVGESLVALQSADRTVSVVESSCEPLSMEKSVVMVSVSTQDTTSAPHTQQEGGREGVEGRDLNVQEEEEKAGSCSRVEDREEPVPGMLFFSSQPEQSSDPENPHDGLPALSPHKAEERDEEVAVKEEEEEEEEEVVEETLSQGEGEDDTGNSGRVLFPLRRMVSHEFLEMRFKIQLLLEPQQYMALLPHHIMVKIFSLLPTQTLAALKCTCHYFKFIIESYGVRPADSRWVCDPRYRDDPCKQCKRRYGRGDVSLCRWHHKPYCQALPYGPGYWMCCHGSHKDTPGCNVGLHDNRWVPAFHSINMPIYKKARESEEDS
ncbi:hypothetical protein JZ751_002722 [Albula glossodonta]|uniref:F-box domain-containing protein n=1 Tax=Albula glossodonta TaxID=121402 RepID=A0A8T2N7N8_9TELE|nr:hypothetical protein JZ751_002722 [Albula glossodonta]